MNIWDIRPDPKYGTGGIVNFAVVPVPITNKAGDWEAEFCRVAEAYPRVLAYAKNHSLGFEVPYRRAAPSGSTAQTSSCA